MSFSRLVCKAVVVSLEPVDEVLPEEELEPETLWIRCCRSLESWPAPAGEGGAPEPLAAATLLEESLSFELDELLVAALWACRAAKKVCRKFCSAAPTA